MDVDRRVVKLLGGSTWLLDTESLLLPVQDVIVIFPEPDPTAGEKDIKKRIKHLPKKGLFVVDGELVPATLIEGLFVRSNGTLLTVVESMGDGAVLRTDDGSLLACSQL